LDIAPLEEYAAKANRGSRTSPLRSFGEKSFRDVSQAFGRRLTAEHFRQNVEIND
jgi:hypothetical protein